MDDAKHVQDDSRHGEGGLDGIAAHDTTNEGGSMVGHDAACKPVQELDARVGRGDWARVAELGYPCRFMREPHGRVVGGALAVRCRSLDLRVGIR